MKSLLTSALALAVRAAPGSAQEVFADANDAPARVVSVDPPLVPTRLVNALESPTASIRAEAMHAMLTLAYNEPQGIDLRPATPALLTIFREDADARHRTFALRCLEASGDESVMASLRAVADRDSDPAVRRLLFSVLIDHYGAEELRGDVRVGELVRSIKADLRG